MNRDTVLQYESYVYCLPLSLSLYTALLSKKNPERIRDRKQRYRKFERFTSRNERSVITADNFAREEAFAIKSYDFV